VNVIDMNRYCEKCGSKLISEGFVRLPFGYPRYNDENGNRNYMVPFRCPKKRWWNFGHDKFGLNATYLGREITK